MDREKYLIIPDIHAKFYLLDAIEQQIPEYDKLVFLGDYVDDWNTPPQVSYNTLRRIIDLKLKYPSKIILLIGNHDTSYLFAGRFKCSGYNHTAHGLVEDLYRTELNGEPIFNLAFSKGRYLFTHAGLTRSFWRELRAATRKYHPELIPFLKETPRTTTLDISDLLNDIFKIGLNNPTDKLLELLSHAGPARGGRDNPSPLWADRDELLEDPLSYIRIRQVVGHTPVPTVEAHPQGRKASYTPQIYFCDTLSTYLTQYGIDLPIGDYSLLELSFGKTDRAKWKVIPKNNWLPQ